MILLTAASHCNATLTCCCRLAQITKESFDFAQALLDLVVLAAAVDTRRCRERFGHLYGRRWSQRERRPFLRQMAACTIARDMGTHMALPTAFCAARLPLGKRHAASNPMSTALSRADMVFTVSP